MAGTLALNSKLFYSDDSGSTYDQVGDVTTIMRPTPSKADVDVTTLTSTAKENLKDVPDYGSATYAFNFDGTDSVHQDLLALEASNASRQWLVELPETGVSTVTTAVYQGIVESVEVSAGVGGKQEATLNVRVTGGVTNAHGATAQS